MHAQTHNQKPICSRNFFEVGGIKSIKNDNPLVDLECKLRRNVMRYGKIVMF